MGQHSVLHDLFVLPLVEQFKAHRIIKQEYLDFWNHFNKNHSGFVQLQENDRAEVLYFIKYFLAGIAKGSFRAGYNWREGNKHIVSHYAKSTRELILLSFSLTSSYDPIRFRYVGLLDSKSKLIRESAPGSYRGNKITRPLLEFKLPVPTGSDSWEYFYTDIIEQKVNLKDRIFGKYSFYKTGTVFLQPIVDGVNLNNVRITSVKGPTPVHNMMISASDWLDKEMMHEELFRVIAKVATGLETNLILEGAVREM